MPKQALVLVPGLLCTKALWAPQLAALADAADCTVADHARHDTMAGIAAALLAEAPARFALAGLSMGGYIAFEVMRQAPERVTRLALLDTGPRADTPAQTQGRLRRNAVAREQGLDKVMDELLPLFLHKDRLADAALVGTVRQMAADTGVEAFQRQQAAIMGRPDSRPMLASIRCPTLVLVGRDDVLTPVALAQEMASAIAGARLEVIADCGHLSTIERPEPVNRALRAWLAA